MPLEKHDLHHEFPEFDNEIRELKTTDNHFARLFKEYHELDHEVHRIEGGVENTSDEYLETQKKQRLNLKDQLFVMLKKAQAVA
ncbi:YdcH family protein [Colwelliaceae bacterium 6441]